MGLIQILYLIESLSSFLLFSLSFVFFFFFQHFQFYVLPFSPPLLRFSSFSVSVSALIYLCLEPFLHSFFFLSEAFSVSEMILYFIPDKP